MCCRGRGSRRGFGPGRGGFGPGFRSHGCGPSRGFVPSPGPTYEHRPSPRGFFGMIAAKRTAKKADRDGNFEPLSEPTQTYYDAKRVYRDEKLQQQEQQAQYQWVDVTHASRNFEIQEEKEVNQAKLGNGKQSYQNLEASNERPDPLQVAPPRYSMVMRE